VSLVVVVKLSALVSHWGGVPSPQARHASPQYWTRNLHLETNSVRWELIRRGIFMLHLYFVAFGAVAAANIIAVIAIAATMKRDRSRLWPLWLWPNLPK
jgi:hypothetical protein